MSQDTSRPGLYILVIFCFLNSCQASEQATNAAKELKRIANAVAAQAPND